MLDCSLKCCLLVWPLSISIQIVSEQPTLLPVPLVYSGAESNLVSTNQSPAIRAMNQSQSGTMTSLSSPRPWIGKQQAPTHQVPSYIIWMNKNALRSFTSFFFYIFKGIKHGSNKLNVVRIFS